MTAKQYLREHLKTVVIAAIAGVIAAAGAAWAAQTNYLGTVFIADTTTPTNQLKVNADGSINVNGGGGFSLSVGAANFTPGQVSVGATSTLIAAARTGVSGTGRVAITVVNAGTTPVYLGGSGVTTSTGALLPGVLGATVTINTTAAIYGIVTTGSEAVTEFETY